MAGFLQGAKNLSRKFFADTKPPEHQEGPPQGTSALSYAGKWILRKLKWKGVGYVILGIFLFINITIPIFQASAAASSFVENFKRVLPSYASSSSEFSPEEQAELQKIWEDLQQEDDGIEMNQLLECIKGWNGTTDPVLTQIANRTIPQGTDFELARAWTLYEASSPKARMIVQHAYPELIDVAGGEISYTPEQIDAVEERVYTFEEISQLWDEYKNKGNEDPFEFVKIISPQSFPYLFESQLPAVMWGVIDKGDVVGDKNVMMDELSESCYKKDVVSSPKIFRK